MTNIANNTYLFYGDKDELVKCHKMLNDIYEGVNGEPHCPQEYAALNALLTIFDTPQEWEVLD